MDSLSIFDNQDYTQPQQFWRKESINIQQRQKQIRVLLEDYMLRKSNKSGNLIPKKYIVFEDILIKCKDIPEQNEVKITDLSTLHVQEFTLISFKETYQGFRLIHNRKAEEIYTKNKQQYEMWQTILRQHCFFRDFQWQYRSLKLIGEGGFAKVYKALKNKDMIEYAVKSISIKALKTKEENKRILLNEIQLLRNLNHECIVKLNEVYENESNIYIVQELMRGGHILEKISKKGFYTEQDASMLMQKLFDALNYLHERNIVHRDIKLDNIILIDNNNDSNIKIIDFGLACKLDSQFYYKRCGTPGFTAPEILNKLPYDTKVDLFSAGVVLYIMLVGQLPFSTNKCSDLIKQNTECNIEFNFPDETLKPSDSAIDLLKKLLDRNPKTRINAKDALNHPWITTKAADAPQRVSRGLKSAQDNMRKYLEEERFNVARIKPAGGFQVTPKLIPQQNMIYNQQQQQQQQQQYSKKKPLKKVGSDEQIESEEYFDKFDAEAEIFDEEAGIYEIINKLNKDIYLRKPSKDTFSSGFNSQSNSANSSNFASPNINTLNYMNSPLYLMRKIEALQNAAGTPTSTQSISIVNKKIKTVTNKLKNLEGQ